MQPRSLETFIHDGVKDELLPSELPGFKPGTEFIRHLLEHCPFYVTDPNAPDTLPFDSVNLSVMQATGICLRQPSSRHARSFEVISDDLAEPWHDEFGNIYGSLNLKGNNFSHPGLIETATATDRLIAYGLQESAVIRRVLRASRLLRENGIGTEYIVGLAEPKLYGWPKIHSTTDSIEYLNLPAYKQRLVERYWLDSPEDERTAERLVELSANLERTTFFVSLRAMDTSIRIDDTILDMQNRSEVLSFANRYLLPDDRSAVETTSESPLIDLMEQVTIPRIAGNLAKMHHMGLAHRYPNGMNITALGSIVDLDSVHGEPLDLGDEPITSLDIVNDLATVSETLHSLESHIYRFKMTDPNRPNLANKFFQLYYQTAQDLRSAFSSEMNFQYFSELALAAEMQTMIEDRENILAFMRIADSFTNTVGQQYFSEVVDQARQEVTTWLANATKQLEPRLFDSLVQEVPALAQLLVEEHISNVRKEREFDPITALLEERSEAYSTIEALCNKLCLDLKKAYELEIDTNQGEIPAGNYPARVWLGRKYLADAVEWDDLAGTWAYEFVRRQLPNLRFHFEQAYNLRRQRLLFEEFPSERKFASAPGFITRETPHVPISVIADYIEKSTDPVELVLPSENVNNADLSVRIFIAPDGSALSQIITDNCVDLTSRDYDVVNTEFYCEALTSKYLLFVEQAPDDTLRLKLWLAKSSAKELPIDLTVPPSNQQIAAMLRQMYLQQGQLFNDLDYHRRDILTVSFSV